MIFILDILAVGGCQGNNQLILFDTPAGQSTVPLAEYFDKVIGVDLNGEQLTRAPKHERVSFRVGPGESFPYLEDGSVDLAICVDALHWLDVTELMKEMRRVLRDDGVFCGVYFPFGNLDLKEADEAFDKVRYGWFSPRLR